MARGSEGQEPAGGASGRPGVPRAAPGACHAVAPRTCARARPSTLGTPDNSHKRRLHCWDEGILLRRLKKIFTKFATPLSFPHEATEGSEAIGYLAPCFS